MQYLKHFSDSPPERYFELIGADNIGWHTWWDHEDQVAIMFGCYLAYKYGPYMTYSQFHDALRYHSPWTLSSAYGTDPYVTDPYDNHPDPWGV